MINLQKLYNNPEIVIKQDSKDSSKYDYKCCQSVDISH